MKAGNIARYAAGFILAYPLLGGASQARFSLKDVFDLQVNIFTAVHTIHVLLGIF